MKRNIVLYGAGKIGQKNFNFLKMHGMEKFLLAWCDKNYKNIGDIDGVPIQSYEALKDADCVYIVSLSRGIKEIIQVFEKDGKQYYASMLSWIYENFTGGGGERETLY